MTALVVLGLVIAFVLGGAAGEVLTLLAIAAAQRLEATVHCLELGEDSTRA